MVCGGGSCLRMMMGAMLVGLSFQNVGRRSVIVSEYVMTIDTSPLSVNLKEDLRSCSMDGSEKKCFLNEATNVSFYE